MYYRTSLLALVALVAHVHSHGVILSAVGDSGKSQGFLVDPTLARNCTTISPCQQDATIIRNSEITQNIVNSCGRTEIAGNIDVGEQTENELAAKRVTMVSKGSTMAVTIHQVNADGAGPYECDLDVTSNAATKFIPLKVTNNVPGANGLSQAKEQDFVINVQMPDNFNCIGASTGNICTVRCRNNAVAGPFGGCFAVQQSDGQGRKDSTAAGVDTAQTLQGIQAQILQNQQDLDVAIAANQAAGAAGGNEGASAISALVSATPTAAAGKGQGQGQGQGQNAAPAATPAATAGAGAANGNAKGNGNANNGSANNGKANQNANAGQNNNNNAAGNGNAANNQQGNANANGNAQTGNAATGNAATGNANGNANGATAGNGAGRGNGNGNGRNQKNKRALRFFS